MNKVIEETDYYVDQRVGCIAVCQDKAPSNGLHQDDEHVVAFWVGCLEDGEWHITPNDKEQAHRFCNTLNQQAQRVKVLAEALELISNNADALADSMVGTSIMHEIDSLVEIARQALKEAEEC